MIEAALKIKNPENLQENVGANGETRTRDLLITNQLLYRLSYVSKLRIIYHKKNFCQTKQERYYAN